MSENVLIPLSDLQLPGDFPWRVGFVAMVDDQLRKLRATGHFLPPRFFGYYFQGGVPIGIGGSWTVSLDATRPASLIPGLLERETLGHYSIATDDSKTPPDFLLVHDRRDGACWLWTFADGVRFVESAEPIFDGGGCDDAEAPRLFGP